MYHSVKSFSGSVYINASNIWGSKSYAFFKCSNSTGTATSMSQYSLRTSALILCIVEINCVCDENMKIEFL